MRCEYYNNNRYLATEVDTGKYVLWTEIVVGDKDYETIQTWVQFAMEFSKKAPAYLMKVKSMFSPADKSIVVVISDYFESITVKDYLLKNSNALLLDSNQESYTKLVRRLVFYMTHYITLLSAVHPPMYLPMCSLNNIYISADLERINLVYIPLFLYQIQCAAENRRYSMPAEVLDGNTPSIATSMYSLGLCLLQLLTVTPDSTSSPIESYLSQLHDPVLSLCIALSLPDVPIEVHIRPKDPSLPRSFDKPPGSRLQSPALPGSAPANPVERERGDVRALLQFLLPRAKPFLSPRCERFEPSFRILQHGGRADELIIQLAPTAAPTGSAPTVSIPVSASVSIPKSSSTASIPTVSAPTASIPTATRTTRGIAAPRIRGAVPGHDSDRFLQSELGFCAAGWDERVGAGKESWFVCK